MSELTMRAQVYLNDGGNKKHSAAINALHKLFPADEKYPDWIPTAKLKFSFDTVDEDDCFNIGIRYTDKTNYQTEEILMLSILGMENIEALRNHLNLAMKYISAEILERKEDEINKREEL